MAIKKIFFPFFFLTVSLHAYSQRIENVDFVVKNNNIEVTYDLADCSKKELYDIKLIITCDNKSIDPVSVTGDLNRISCGKHKKIEWNVLNDNIEIKGKTQVKVVISKTHSTRITGGPSNAFLSMLLPGVGDYFVNRPSEKWYYISALYLGSAYFTLSSKMQSDKFYDQYHRATTQQEMDDAYKTANDQYQVFQVMAGAMGAIWVADVVYVAVKGFKNRKKQLDGTAYHEPKTKLYFAGTGKSFQFGLVRKF